jgi:co-chaperonin GroES (HSP10)
MIRATNNTILGVPNYEVQRRMSHLASAGAEEIHTKQFGVVRVGRTSTYENKPGQNKMAWGSVVSVGPGAAWMNGKYRLDRILKPGDVIGFDTSQYTDWKDGDTRLMMLPVDAALCLFNPGMAAPQALGVYFASVPDEAAARRFVLGKAGQGAGFILTNDTAKGEIRVTDNPHSKVRFSAERVTSVGAGGMSIGDAGQQALGDTRAYTTISVDGGIKKIRVREPIEIIPEPEAVGMMAVFNNTMSVDCLVQGTRYRFSCWDRVRCLAGGDD